MVQWVVGHDPQDGCLPPFASPSDLRNPKSQLLAPHDCVGDFGSMSQRPLWPSPLHPQLTPQNHCHGAVPMY